MAYNIKSTRGRKKVNMKMRNLRAITPKGFTFHKSKGDMAYYKRA